MSDLRSELLVIGNGPSLRGYDFSEFTGWKTLGMNAAYRFWDRIDWRPTYYCCLDDALIDTHKGAIRTLILENRIEKFFLTARFLEHYPDMISESRVRYLDEFVPHWHRVRGEGLGLEFVSDAAFKTGSPEMLTTGAYSVRFGAFLGFNVIRLLGVDLTYQSLDQVSEMGGTRLVLDATPEENPNYFFSDYQQAGDQFNVANPEQHGRELHLHSFVALRDDFVRNEVPVRVLNANLQSKLFSEAIFPYLPLEADPEALFASDGSATVVLDTHTGPTLENLFWLWSQPAFFPVMGTTAQRSVDLELVVPREQVRGSNKRLRKLSRRYPKLRECFRNIIVRENAGQHDKQLPRLSSTPEVRFIDESMVPIHCDWLNCLVGTESATALSIELSVSIDSAETLTSIRVNSPNRLFLCSADTQRTLARFRQSGDPVDLGRFVEESNGEPGEIDGARSGLFNLLRFWRT